MTKIQQQPEIPSIALDDGDTPMANEERLRDVEYRLQQLENTLQTQHHQQQTHNAEVAGQITQIQAQVDQQSITMKEHLDTKMNEQLAHIERLLIGTRTENGMTIPAGTAVRSADADQFCHCPFQANQFCESLQTGASR